MRNKAFSHCSFTNLSASLQIPSQIMENSAFTLGIQDKNHSPITLEVMNNEAKSKKDCIFEENKRRKRQNSSNFISIGSPQISNIESIMIKQNINLREHRDYLLSKLKQSFQNEKLLNRKIKAQQNKINQLQQLVSVYEMKFDQLNQYLDQTPEKHSQSSIQGSLSFSIEQSIKSLKQKCQQSYKWKIDEQNIYNPEISFTKTSTTPSISQVINIQQNCNDKIQDYCYTFRIPRLNDNKISKKTHNNQPNYDKNRQTVRKKQINKNG